MLPSLLSVSGPICWLGYDLAYVHIPKNAGHTIESSMGIDYDDVQGDQVIAGYKCSAKMYEDCNYAQFGLKLFSSLRNPFDRAVSAYHHRQERLEKIGRPTQTFPEFVRWLTTFDIHFMDWEGPKSYTPQFDCIVGNTGGAVVQNFVRLETLARDWERLQRVYPGLPGLMDGANEAGAETSVAYEATSAGLMAVSEALHGRPEWCAFYQDAGTTNTVVSLYSIDFSFANYTSNITEYCA